MGDKGIISCYYIYILLEKACNHHLIQHLGETICNRALSGCLKLKRDQDTQQWKGTVTCSYPPSVPQLGGQAFFVVKTRTQTLSRACPSNLDAECELPFGKNRIFPAGHAFSPDIKSGVENYRITEWSGLEGILQLILTRFPLAFSGQGMSCTKHLQRDDRISPPDFSSVAGSTEEWSAPNPCNHLKGFYIP